MAAHTASPNGETCAAQGRDFHQIYGVRGTLSRGCVPLSHYLYLGGVALSTETDIMAD